MAQTSSSQPLTTSVSAASPPGQRATTYRLGLRRLAAWGLEIGLVAGSIAVPWGLGEAVRQTNRGSDLVPLNPVVVSAQGAIARSLGLPREQTTPQVPPLTNLLWFGALVLPTAVAGAQVYGLASRGSTWPKAWLGLRVVGIDRRSPGLPATVARELGRWGVPLTAAYLLWVGSGAFPSLPWLGGLALVSGLGAAAVGQSRSFQRGWYDALAGTRVVLWRGGPLPQRYSPGDADTVTDTALVEPLSAMPLAGLNTEESGGLTALVLSPTEAARALAPQGWRRYGPLVGTLAGMVVLGGMAALWLDRRLPSAQQSDALFLALVENLSQRATSFGDRQAAALALASSQDPRAVPLLVDLLAQTDDPALLNTLQQALVTLGPPAIPALQRLNLALANDLLALPADQQYLAQLRQRTVKRTLAKILVLHSGTLNGVDLSGTHLGQVIDGPDTFTLVLEQHHLAGIVWRNAVLSGARLRKATFFDPGADGRIDTFDDWITDFSGSDLTEVSLVAAPLRRAQFRNVSLLRANLSNALAPYADFSGANAGSAWLIAADLRHGRFDRASLVGADLTDADLGGASLVETRLQQATLRAANLSTTDLRRADLTGADLGEADLTGANLGNTNLSGANLVGANLAGANLDGTNLAGAQLVAAPRWAADGFVAPIDDDDPTATLAGVDFSKAVNLGGDQLSQVCSQGGLHPACGSEF